MTAAGVPNGLTSSWDKEFRLGDTGTGGFQGDTSFCITSVTKYQKAGENTSVSSDSSLKSEPEISLTRLLCPGLLRSLSWASRNPGSLYLSTARSHLPPCTGMPFLHPLATIAAACCQLHVICCSQISLCLNR